MELTGTSDDLSPQAADEILSRYAAGERNFAKTDLVEGSSFRGAKLSGSNFRESWLSGVDFTEADLRQVCFDDSNVKVSNFRGADLRGASFRRAALCGAEFLGARLENVAVEGAHCYGGTITDITQLLQPATQNPPAGFAFLVRNTSVQEEDFRGPLTLLQKAIADLAFPGCALAVTLRGELVAHHAFGRFTYDQAAPPVTTASIFDVASVTKVIATTTMAMILYERGLLDLEAPVTAIVPEFGSEDPRRREVTLRMLLAHSSGLPAYEKLFLRAKNREELLAAAFSTALTANPATRAEYSDLGFIILGVALERVADEPLDTFCQREIFGPLGMSHTTFNPPQSWKEKIVPTADERPNECSADTLVREPPQSPAPSASSSFRGRVIQGEVLDENASILGGIAGHAGLFSTAEDVALFAHAMLSGGRPILRPETIDLFTRREAAPGGTSRALGWDTPSSPSQSGKYFSPRSYGHLGYTGTSLWIDPDRQLSITLLTNRTWPDCQNQAVKQVRPAFHDAIIEALKSGGLIP